MDCNTRTSYLGVTISQSFLKLMSIEWVVLSNHLILCNPLFLLPSIFPSIRVFSNLDFFYWQVKQTMIQIGLDNCCSVAKLCPTFCSPLNCSMPGSSVLHCLLEFAQIHVQLSQWCYLTISFSAFPFSFGLSLSQHQGLFQWVGFSHQVVKVLEHQSFQGIFSVDFF